MISIGVSVSVSLPLALEVGQVMVCLAQHPNREREFEVRIGNSAGLVEHAFDGLLGPRAILETLKTEMRRVSGKK